MPPNPKCIVCSSKPQVVIKIDTTRVTVKQFRDDVLVKALNMVDPDVIVDGKGVIVISSEEGETECNNEKTLSDMNIVDGCILKVDDFFQNYELSIIIVHKELEREGDLYEIIADPDTLKADNTTEEASPKDDKNGEPEAKRLRREQEDSDDDLCLIEDDDENGPSTSNAAQTRAEKQNGSKPSQDVTDDCIIDDEMDDQNQPSTSTDLRITPKKRKVDGDSAPASKRFKVAQDADDDVVIIDDD